MSRNREYWGEFADRQQKAVATIISQQGRTGRLLKCPMPECLLSFMELAPSEYRNLALAEHLYWDHDLAPTEMYEQLGKSA